MSTNVENTNTSNGIAARNDDVTKKKIELLLKLREEGFLTLEQSAIRMGLSVDEFNMMAKEFGLL